MASSSEDVSQKFTSQGRRIHHHYDLVTVTMENVQPQSVCLYMCAEVLVLGGPWGLHSFLHIHTHTLASVLLVYSSKSPQSGGRHWTCMSTFGPCDCSNARTCAHANTHTQITQIHAQSQPHTPTHNEPLQSLWRHFILGGQFWRIWGETETDTVRVRGMQIEEERKTENFSQNNVIMTSPPSRVNEWH